jgi:hypothetical protein
MTTRTRTKRRKGRRGSLVHLKKGELRARRVRARHWTLPWWVIRPGRTVKARVGVTMKEAGVVLMVRKARTKGPRKRSTIT